MFMSQEYYTIENKNNLGERHISTNAFQLTAVNVINDIEGVDFEGGTKNMIPGIKDSLTVKINDHNQVIIQANVVVNYGVNVGKTVNKIQNNIINAIDEMMGFRNVKVNVNVNDIKF